MLNLKREDCTSCQVFNDGLVWINLSKKKNFKFFFLKSKSYFILECKIKLCLDIILKDLLLFLIFFSCYKKYFLKDKNFNFLK